MTTRTSFRARLCEVAMRAAFLRIYNTNFVSVPGTATYTEGDVARLLGDPGATRAGLLLLDGVPVGNYELCGCGTDTPELAAIGINAEKRGQGLGGRALRLLLACLADAGAKRVLLKVSTANPAAYRLYRSAGFQKERTLCRWYTLDAL